MKKKLLLCCVVVLSFFICGCTKVIELSEEENYLIAEYAAELLMKYDRNFDPKYDEGSLQTEAVTTEMATVPEETTESLTTETVEIVTTESSTTETESEDDSGNGDGGGTGSITEEQDVSGVDADVDKSFDIGAFVGEANVAITYSYYMIVDHYPSYDKEGMYMEIQAPSGYQLLVLKFNLENRTNAEQKVDLYSKDIDYNIIVNNKKSAHHMLTILIDDLYTYQANLAASDRQEVVLLFQISDKAVDSITDLKLKVNNGKESKVIQLDH